MSKYGNPFEVNDMTIGSDYLPSEVASLVNKNVCNGGGGGGTQTTSSQIDPDIKKHITPVLADVRRLYEQGKLGQVADTSGTKAALDAASGLAQDQMNNGLGTENLLNQLRSTEGQVMQGQQGALGSARGDRAREAAMADKAMQLQQADMAVRNQGSDRLTGAAEAARGLTQEELDAEAKNAERFFGYLGSAPQGQTQTTTGGGGK